LKERIRISGVRVRENYADPEALAELVLADFTALINDLFPPEASLGIEERERSLHRAFARSREGVYIARASYLERLDEHVRIENGRPRSDCPRSSSVVADRSKGIDDLFQFRDPSDPCGERQNLPNLVGAYLQPWRLSK